MQHYRNVLFVWPNTSKGIFLPIAHDCSQTWAQTFYHETLWTPAALDSSEYTDSQTDRQSHIPLRSFPVSGGDKDKQVTSLPPEDNHTGTGQEPPEVPSLP